MRGLAVLGLMLLLAGCGADGAPLRPTLSGTVSAGSGGVRTSGAVGVESGPVRVVVGF